MNRYPRRRKSAARPASVNAEWVFGLHAVRVLLQRGPERIRRVVVSAARQDRRLTELVGAANVAGVAVETVAGEELEALLPGKVHQGVAALTQFVPLLDEPALKQHVYELPHAPLLLMLDGVEDPRNLGACLRSADAAGVDAVVIPNRRAATLTPAAMKTACGAAVSLPLAQVPNLVRIVRWAKSRGIHVVGTAESAELPLHRAELSGGLLLVLGGEGRGLRRLTRELCDEVVALPMKGVVESLNVSVVAGVCLYEALRQREAGAADH